MTTSGKKDREVNTKTESKTTGGGAVLTSSVVSRPPRLVLPQLGNRPDYRDQVPTHLYPCPNTTIPMRIVVGKDAHNYGEDVWYNVCGRKKAFFDKGTAEFNALRIGSRKKGMIMTAYQCVFCEWWHIGHKDKKKQEQEKEEKHGRKHNPKSGAGDKKDSGTKTQRAGSSS